MIFALIFINGQFVLDKLDDVEELVCAYCSLIYRGVTQTPLDHSDIFHSCSLLLALEIATALLYPILMHSLIL